MAETVGTIQVVATMNTKDYESGKKQIEKGNEDLEKSNGKLGNAFAKAGAIATASLVAIGAGVTALVTSSVKGFAEYEQLVGGVDTLFKDSSKTVQNYAENAYKTAGLTANQYMETVTGFSASLLQSLGGDTAKSAQIGNMAVEDMSDNANKMGTAMSSIQMAYQGFAKQNYTMLDNLKLGYGGTKTEMERLLKDAEKMPSALGRKFDISNYSDVIEAIHVVQTEMGITGTTALEADKTISGSFNSMKSAWGNLITGMTNPDADMNVLLDRMIQSALKFGDNVLPAIERALTGVVTLVAGLLPKVINMIPSLIDKLLPVVITTFIALVVQLANMLPTLIPTLVNGVLLLLNGILDAIDQIVDPVINGVIQLFDGVIRIMTTPGMLTKVLNGAIKLFMAIVMALPQIIDALIQAFPTIISAIIGLLTDPNFIMMLVKASVMLFMALVMAVPLILSSLVKAIGTLIGELWNQIQHNFTQFGANFGQAIGDSIKTGVNGVLGFIENMVNGIMGNINSMLKIIDDIIPGDQSGMRLPKIRVPRLAEGGVISKPTLAMVGEGSESEAVIPLSKLDAMLDNSGGGVTINQNNNVYTELDMNLINRNLTWELGRA